MTMFMFVCARALQQLKHMPGVCLSSPPFRPQLSLPYKRMTRGAPVVFYIELMADLCMMFALTVF